jgi:hypothetical protein
MPLNEDEKASVESIIDVINGQIQQATIIYNRHAGVATGKKKDEEVTNVEEEND